MSELLAQYKRMAIMHMTLSMMWIEAFERMSMLQEFVPEEDVS